MKRHRIVTLSVIAALVVGAGCAIGSGESQQRGGGPLGGGFGRGEAPSPEKANAVFDAALADVERFWRDAYPKVSGGKRFEAVSGGFHPYTRDDPPPACGPARWEYQPNAFYCSAGDFIAWDAETLVPQLHADYGDLLVAVVVAHEYGHAIQTRLGAGGQPTIVLEQQADCYAGAWIADITAGRSGTFGKPAPADLDSAVAGVLTLRDQPGLAATSPEAHGNAFDRVRALQEGTESGPAKCAGYSTGNLPVTEVPFSTQEEAQTGGDLPYAEAVKLLSEDVQAYWSAAYPRLANGTWSPLKIVPFDPDDPPACKGREPTRAFTCPAEGFVAFDNRELGPQLHEHIGDFAVGMLVGGLFAEAAQERRNAPTQGRDGQRAVDCLAGSWTNDLLTREQSRNLQLSPGDLDEAVATLLVFGRNATDAEVSAFDRIAAYRDGTINGLQACA